MCIVADAKSASEVCNREMQSCMLTGSAKRDKERQKCHRRFDYISEEDLLNEDLVDTDDAVRHAFKYVRVGVGRCDIVCRCIDFTRNACGFTPNACHNR
jgi:hypothetical protein